MCNIFYVGGVFLPPPPPPPHPLLAPKRSILKRINGNVIPLHKTSTFCFWLFNLYTVWWCYYRLSTETFSCEYIYDVFRGRSSTSFKFLLIQLEKVCGWYTRICYSQKSTVNLNKLNVFHFSMFILLLSKTKSKRWHFWLYLRHEVITNK